MTQTPAGWYADPEDDTQQRYWDGAAWTEDRVPRTSVVDPSADPSADPTAGSTAASTSERLSTAGHEVADRIAGGFSSLSSWVQQQASAASSAVGEAASNAGSGSAGGSGQPTFASIAASCRDEPPREPLSAYAELTDVDLPGVGALCAMAGLDVTEDGVQLSHELCRLVPNPWNPDDPTGVAVFVGPHLMGRLPADQAAAYSPPLTQLTQRRLLVTGTATVWALGPGTPTQARVTVSMPEAAALAD